MTLDYLDFELEIGQPTGQEYPIVELFDWLFMYYQRKLSGMMDDFRPRSSGRAGLERSLRGWINHVRYGDTWELRRARLQEVCL